MEIRKSKWDILVWFPAVGKVRASKTQESKRSSLSHFLPGRSPKNRGPPQEHSQDPEAEDVLTSPFRLSGARSGAKKISIGSDGFR